MKSRVFPMVAGALCLPTTYRLSRDGDFLVAFLAIVVVATAGAAIAVAMSGARGPTSVDPRGLAFVLGAFLSETIGFTYYYFDYGYRDRYLSVGVVLSVAEFAGISIVGGVATCVAALALRRVRKRRGISGGCPLPPSGCG